MAELTQDQVVDYVKGITVLELSQLVKRLEQELGVSAAAAAPVMMARWRRRRRGGARRGEDRVHRDADRGRKRQDQRDQGRPRGHQPRSQGSQGPRRERPEGRSRKASRRMRPRRSRRSSRTSAPRSKSSSVGRRRARRRGRAWHRAPVRLPSSQRGSSRAVVAGHSRDGRGATVVLLVASPDPGRARPTGSAGKRVFPGAAIQAAPGSSEHVQPAQERLSRAHRFLEDQHHRPDPEPDRDPEEVLRALPADEPPALGARGRGTAVGVQVGLPDQRLPRELVARVHRVLDRQLGVQVRQARRPAPPAEALLELRRHARRRSVRRSRGALPALRHGQPRARATSATSAARRSR